MPDTQPITVSFPWLLVGIYRPVFDNTNLFSIVVLTNEGGQILTDEFSNVLIVSEAGLGDRYRYI